MSSGWVSATVDAGRPGTCVFGPVAPGAFGPVAFGPALSGVSGPVVSGVFGLALSGDDEPRRG
ncbi:hypothetical protein [Micromonospora antibiotica]|uniref:Uncharacterized protein n=1 Tax=Micromonospora antibiotica TaxID=2807623 RepID=A0ABS3VFX8_9ACTN|nr:hypothetical protein [Micromonospora antibiotica]MBO4164539.1 hypothetical protein [Micromonospora antibiotica]